MKASEPVRVRRAKYQTNYHYNYYSDKDGYVMICVSPGYDLRGFLGAKCPESNLWAILSNINGVGGGGRGGQRRVRNPQRDWAQY